MMPVIHVGPAALPSRPLVLLVAFWASAYLAEREGNRLGLDGEWVWSWAGVSMIGGLVGARIAYVLQNWPAYRDGVGSIASFNLLAMDWTGGAVVALLVALAYLRWRGPATAPFADSLAMPLAVALTLASLGSLLSGDAYGSPTSLPWAITLWDASRHPTQVYEMLVGLATLGVVWHSHGQALPAGHTFLRGSVAYAVGRLLVEAFRADNLLLPGGFRVAQVASLLILMAALWLLRPPAAEIETTRSPRAS